MRRAYRDTQRSKFSILTLDDDPIITATLQSYFQRCGYSVDAEHEPYAAIERIRSGHYDILLLDFLMTPICGDQVVAEIRKFNKDIFIILLTGHKSVAPPIKTIRELDIQGYYEKSDRFDQLELLVESCAKSISQMRTIRSYENGLSEIIDAMPQIYQLQSLDSIMDHTVSTAAALFGSSTCTFELSSSAVSGQPTGNITRALGSEINVPALDTLSIEPELLEKHVIYRAPWVCAAIFNNAGDIVGLLSICTEDAPNDDRIQLLRVFSRQITGALSNLDLHSEVSRKNSELTQAYSQLHDSYMEMVHALRLMVDARDIYTCGHSDRVSEFAVRIAKAMGKDDAYCQQLRVAALFHDIGKVGVPDHILLKTGRLTDEEYAVIKTHPQEGARILSAISMFRDIVPIVRAHHERFDGRGYPDGLAGYDIPEQARIIAVADSFDAMTSDRSYRSALSIEQALDQLRQGCGTQFDADIVKAFLGISGEISDIMANHQHLERSGR